MENGMKRRDGRKIKSLDPFMRVVPHVMRERSDSMIMFQEDFVCDGMDAYIKEKKAEGIKVTYIDIVAAGIVRMLALMPSLNRFIMNGRVYARNNISFSYALQKDLKGGSSETTIKLEFAGTETLMEVRDKIQAAADEVTKTKGTVDTETDKVAAILAKLPDWLFKFAVTILMWMDKHNCLPKMVMDASPFHTSFFITNMKSLGINYVFHHVYNFGTAGIFIGLGKDKTKVVADLDDQPEVRKMLPLGVVIDERFAEGLDWAKGMKQLKRLLRDPHMLDKPIEKKNEDID
ncbi:MAG: 2-oxoglutarate dehydrogenase [Clostridiales bacterium]|nr:2-oxoglutarate dehydrogenase [Clostridiales bacterium]